LEASVAASVVKRVLQVLCGVAIIAALSHATQAKAGLLGTGSGSYCDPTATQAFSPFGDSSYYARLYNGNFENGSLGWALSGGARVVSGNEPYYLSGNRTDSNSLLLPAGSSAYSGTVCFAFADWHLRFMAKRVSGSGSLHVQVVVPSLLGLLTVLDGGTVSGNGTWAPSPRMELLLCNITSLLGTKAVAFRFTPVGAGTAFQMDDVYLDPWKST
jgi:hypothetical protein